MIRKTFIEVIGSGGDLRMLNKFKYRGYGIVHLIVEYQMLQVVTRIGGLGASDQAERKSWRIWSALYNGACANVTCWTWPLCDQTLSAARNQ